MITRTTAPNWKKPADEPDQDRYPYDRFLAKCGELAARRVRHSVGIVGLPDHLDRARQLRADLPGQVYLWVNAAEGHIYTEAEAAEWTALDPLFGYSRHPHRSAGLPCRTGASVISVDGDGTVRRCHFVPTELGNLYDGSYRAALRPRPCPLSVCDCHIGYVHLESLPLYDVFAGGVLERVPAPPPPVGSWSVGHTASPSIPLVTTSVTEPHVTETESPLPRPSPPG